MQTVKVVVLIVFFLVVCITITYTVLTKPAVDPAVQQAQTALHVEQLMLQRAHLQRNANLRFYGAVFLLALIGLALLIVASGLHRATVKHAAVHTYKIGKYNEVVVHERDLSLAAPVAMGLMNAEQLRQMNGGVAKALELYERMADVQSKQIQSLVGPKGIPLTPSQAALPAQVQPPTEHVPTFQNLLIQGEIAPGKPMIWGYDHGVPRRGSFLDIYSAAVAGESGSGKTATLLFLIGSGLVAEQIRFLGIDPHYPHPKSLGYKLKPLWEAGLMSMATYKDDMLRVLKYVERTIENRLKQRDTDETPVVLVIDELAFLSTTSIGGDIARTMERISMEGRKCAVYLLASSQTWVAAKTGKSSVVRDTLTSAYVHRIKPKQANLLLQDRDEAEKVKKHVKQVGEALLVPVGDESVIVKMPFTTEADMQTLAAMMAEQECKGVLASKRSFDLDQAFQQLTAGVEAAPLPESNSGHAEECVTEDALRRCTKELLASGRLSYGDLDRAGIPRSTAHNWIKNPAKRLKREQRETLEALLERHRQDAGTPAETSVNAIHKCEADHEHRAYRQAGE